MIKELLTSVTLLSTSFLINAQTDAWSRLSSVPASTGTQYIRPNKSFMYSLDFVSMKSILQNAPMENTGHGLNVDIPTPDGGFETFEIWKYNMMEEGLTSQFPNMATFLGRSTLNPASTIRLDYTTQGFHAMVRAIGGSWFIDPIYLNETEHYQVYLKSNLVNTKPFECGVIDETVKTDNAPKTILQNGTQLKTYRLALAATGEYTTFHGGLANALSAQITTMNRVNGVYEIDLAVRMNIIANNNLLIYTNANTDPYTNNDGSTMLGQNNTNVNSVIGSANYDIGHVFSTGGGGVASLGSVCGSVKAQGVTGSGAPVGDPFDIDYVAHEMGHQFGANHTFNSTIGSCGGGNRSSNNAYEPGSGITIMAYAGICGADNLASNSIDNFHVGSYNAIRTFITTGNGNNCDVATSTTNTIPLVDAGPSVYRIPLRTPFRMTAVGSNLEVGEQATYSWEEYDLGNSVALATNATSGTHPLFMPYSPDTSNIRVFPKMQTIVNNATDTKEKLPTYARRLRFRVMIRDNKPNGGAASADSTTIWAAANTGPFLVSSPNAFLTWSVGTSQNVTWDVANTNISPINCQNVNIKLSTDGGYTYPITLLANTPNDGSQAITVPNLGANPVTTCRVMVEAADNIFFDISNANFTIQPGPAVAPVASFAISSGAVCEGGSLTFTDQSTNTPTSWAWTFQGGTPASSTSQNPSNVSYATPGTYTVSLVATNTAGSSTSTQTVTVNEKPTSTFDVTPAHAGQNDGSLIAYPIGGTEPYTIEWATNPSQTGLSATNVSAGTYVVSVSDANGCTSIYNVVVPGNASINETDHFSMSFYPNPTDNLITLSLLEGKYTYEWFDAAGRTIAKGNFKGQIQSFDLSAFSQGVYIFKISDERNTSVKRVIKK